jgi:4-carboxymuconolactone decarboxylase
MAGPAARGTENGYLTHLDGRLIGPFNALLRAPELAQGLGAWTSAIDRQTALLLTSQVREAVILTVVGRWQAEYAVYAHQTAARRVGISEADIDRLLLGQAPVDLGTDATLACDVAWHLVSGSPVPVELHDATVTRFGIAGALALIALVGQYVHTSALLTFFDVPAPDRAIPSRPGSDRNSGPSTGPAPVTTIEEQPCP